MKCEEIQKKLSALIDNELKEEEVSLIREHLKECQGCAEELRAINTAWDFMGTAEEMKPSPYFWTRLSATIAQQEQEKIDLQSYPRSRCSGPHSGSAARKFRGSFVVSQWILCKQ